MRGLPKGWTPMLPIREGVNVQCSSVVCWDSRWALSVFSPPVPAACGAGRGGMGALKDKAFHLEMMQMVCVCRDCPHTALESQV